MGAIVALGAGFLTFTREAALDIPKPPATPAPLTEARFTELEKGTRHFKGSPDARYTVIEFADFQCPSCRFAYDLVIKDFGTKFPQIRFGFRHYPIEGQHPFALPAALMTELADKQGKFWEAYTALIKDPKEELTDGVIEGAVQSLGLSLEEYKKAKTDPAQIQVIQADQSVGHDFGVNQTPTFFVRDNVTKKTMMVTGVRQLFDQLKEVPGLPTPPPPADGAPPAAPTQ